MKKKLNENHIFIITTLVIVLLLIMLATFFDLQINQNLNNPNSSFGIFFDEFGQIPSYLPLPFIFGLFTYYFYSKKELRFKLLSGVMGFISILASYNLVNKFIIDVFFTTNPLFVVGAITLVFGVLVFASLYFLPKKHLNKLTQFALLLLIFIVLTFVETQVIKMLWGRVRFRDLTSTSEFTPWYVLNGFNGNKSFVSGHTSAASAIFGSLFLLLFFEKFKKYKCWLILVCFGFVICVALSRIIVGAHYLSDVVFGFLVAMDAFFAVLIYYKTFIINKQNKKVDF